MGHKIYNFKSTGGGVGRGAKDLEIKKCDVDLRVDGVDDNINPIAGYIENKVLIEECKIINFIQNS